MKTYSYTEAYRNLAMIFDTALNEEVIIKQENGNEFRITSIREKRNTSPLDVEGINTSITTQEIINIIKEGREIRFHSFHSNY
jgi:hypothetical protein